jgi:hypothetical protein
MVCRPAYHFIVFLFILLYSTTSLCQPALPDLAGTVDNGAVLLSWNCQYDGIKTIAVLRSGDSAANFTGIGNVKKTNKGVQSFTDQHPAAGKNFYKLAITFNSGLNWASNVCRVFIDKPVIAATKASDSGSVTRTGTSTRRDTATAKAPVTVAILKRDSMVKQSTSLLPPRRLSLAFEDPTDKPETFILSKYVYTDAVTGHVRLNLPDDITTHHYSIRFYNNKMQVVTESPKINAQQIILDKRNFPGKGLYKYVLRRDVVEFESGYVIIN